MTAQSTEDKFFAILCYLGPLLLIPLIMKKKNHFVYAHLRQGVMFLILFLAVRVISYIPLISIIDWVLEIGIAIIFIMAIIYIVTDREFVIPYFGEIAKKWKI